MKKQFIFLFVAFVAFAIGSFDDMETSNDRTQVINVVDYDSYESQLTMDFSVSNPVNISQSGAIVFNCVNTLNGYISSVEAEERGSPKLTFEFPLSNEHITKVYLPDKNKHWLNRLSNVKLSIGFDCDYLKS